MSWQLAEAKNKLSEVVTLALTSGPQRITRRNQAVIVISEDEYQHLVEKKKNFKEFLMGPGPSFEGLDLTRDQTPMREVEW